MDEIEQNSEKYDIILMDNIMPVMKGVEAAEKIRECQIERAGWLRHGGVSERQDGCGAAKNPRRAEERQAQEEDRRRAEGRWRRADFVGRVG